MARVVHATDAGDRCMRQMGSGKMHATNGGGRCGRQMGVRDSWGGRDLGVRLGGDLVETWWRLVCDLCET